ncbi:MAG TPA: prepilin-type N-terminal cleavage/methylation domain-containing protein [Candidatus Angelobacter sp.]|nr:prepilin-type N-terminal cleavage/methylation domain-containing protein [Candidatus Angelobacter sp.]
MKRSNPVTRAAQAGVKGFTLLELILSLAMLLVVTGAIFEQINRMQKNSQSEAMKLDMSQQAREFVDQTVRDLHMSGFPSPSMYSNPPVGSPMVAAGLVSVSPTQILFEGDVNNDGNVYSVTITYVASDPNDPNCPCVRRAAAQKIPGDSLHQPTSPNYTEVTQVMPPGTNAGQSGEDLFAYYDQNGNPVTVGTGLVIPGDANTIATIKTVKINLSLLNNQYDQSTNRYDRMSISGTARLNQ